MCGPLSHPASSEHHASFNGKTDAPLLTAPKPGKKRHKEQKHPPRWESAIEKVAGACVHGFTLVFRRGQWGWQVLKEDMQEDRVKKCGWVWVEVDDELEEKETLLGNQWLPE